MARLENLLAAQALTLVDRMKDAGSDRLPAAPDRAALVTLLAHPGQSISWLGDVLGLTSSGITRLVDRLQEAGWLRRLPTDDGRSRRLQLTASGRREAGRILRAREQAMSDAANSLSSRDRADLERILGRLVSSLADDRPTALRVCRLCDRAACATADAECPLEHTMFAS